MRRFLLLLAPLVLLALIAWLALRPRESMPAPTVQALAAQAPTTRAESAHTLEEPNVASPVRETQPIAAGAAAASTSTSLPPGSTRVHGHVRCADTLRPIAGAPVQIEYFPPSAEGLNDGSGRRSTEPARSTDDGSYSVEVPAGVLLSRARVLKREPTTRDEFSPDYVLDNYVPSAVELELRAMSGDFELDLQVKAGAILQGQVLEQGSLQPIANAEVVLEAGEATAFGTSTKADGRFTVYGIVLEKPLPWRGRMARVLAIHPDFVRESRQVSPPDAQGRWPEITLLLRRGIGLGGIVVDSTGAPVPRVELSLRPLRATPQGALAEFEGEWKTRSDGTGLFHFPHVPPFEHAWLVTRRTKIGERRWFGESRTLLSGKDPFLTSIELRLAREVGVEVVVLYPDGTPAKREERLLLREDEDGKLRAAREGERIQLGAAREGERIVCATGRTTRIVAWGKARASDEAGVIYRGETFVTLRAEDSDPRAEIQLAPTVIQRASSENASVGMGERAGSWTNSTILLKFVDRLDGEALAEGTGIAIERRDSGTWATLGKYATLRLSLEPGWATLDLRVDGYEPRTIELDVKDNEPQTLTLALDRVH